MTENGSLRRTLSAAASVEVTPRDAARIGEFAEQLGMDTSVYITALPGADLGELVGAAASIRAAGLAPVPHLPARALEGPGQLDRLLGRLVEQAQVDDVLAIAGSVKKQVGSYSSSLEVLRSGILEKHGIRRVGVAGHPEGSPDIPADAARDALLAKNAFAAESPLDLRIVTQFALAADPYISYEREIREQGNRLPVIAGLPGVTSPPTLVKFGIACGIGPSLEVLRKQAGGLVKLATTRLWKPDGIVDEIAAAGERDPEALFAGLHFFPFGGLERTAAWLAAARSEVAAQQA
jgi:methylenetetrahydrofolate reductase (NADPH)